MSTPFWVIVRPSCRQFHTQWLPGPPTTQSSCLRLGSPSCIANKRNSSASFVQSAKVSFLDMATEECCAHDAMNQAIEMTLDVHLSKGCTLDMEYQK